MTPPIWSGPPLGGSTLSGQILSAHGGHPHHLAHLGFAVFCVLVVVFCVVAAKLTGPKPPNRR